MPQQYDYDLDPSGLLAANKIENETHTIQLPTGEMSVFIVPDAAPFFRDGLVVELGEGASAQALIEGVDYYLGHRFIEASNRIGKDIYGSIVFINRNLSGTINLKKYQTLGGAFTLDDTGVVVDLTESLYALRVVTWDQVLGVPVQLPTIEHQQPLEDLKGWDDVVAELVNLTTAVDDLANQQQTPASTDVSGTIKQPMVLTTQTNLDDLTSRGMFICPTPNVVKTARNFPVDDVTGMVTVTYDIQQAGGLIVQEFKQIKNPADPDNAGLGNYPVEWRRYSDDQGDSWSTWDRVDANTIASMINPIQVGMVAMFATATVPAGWLPLHGGTIGSVDSNATARANPDVFALYEKLWNDIPSVQLYEANGDPVATKGASAQADFDADRALELFDDRGLFWRGQNPDPGGFDQQRELGSYQQDMFETHDHNLEKTPGNYTGYAETSGGGGRFSFFTGNGPEPDEGGTETRPMNRAYMPCIKF